VIIELLFKNLSGWLQFLICILVSLIIDIIIQQYLKLNLKRQIRRMNSKNL